MFGPIYRDRIRTVSLTSDYRLQDNFGGTNYLTLNYGRGSTSSAPRTATTTFCRATMRPANSPR